MQFQVETDNHVQGREDLSAYVEQVVRAAVGRHATERVTHIEAHLSDVNSSATGGPSDKKCLLEARVAGVKNVAVSHQADTMRAAIDGAADKLRHALESAIGKEQDRQRRGVGAGHVSADMVDQGLVDQDVSR